MSAVAPGPAGALRPVPTLARPGLRGRALNLLHGGMYWSGAGALYAAMANPRGAIILMYHSVPSPDLAPWIDPRNAMSPELFREQMRFLAARRTVVSMTRLAEMLAAGETPPRGTTLLTFDDGYRDNLLVVAPILAELGLPATLYLPTGYIGRGEPQWVDRLYVAFRSRTRDEIALDERTVSGRWTLAGDAQTRAAYGALCRGLIQSTWAERERVLAAVAQQLAAAAAPPRLMLTWDEVRDLARRFAGFEIGGHTVDHVDVTAHGEHVCRDEVRRCSDDIRRETGLRPSHFSFPYGRCSPDSRRAVAECGFRTAVGGDAAALVTARADALALPRIEAPASRALFRIWTSGTGPHLARRLA